MSGQYKYLQTSYNAPAPKDDSKPAAKKSDKGGELPVPKILSGETPMATGPTQRPATIPQELSMSQAQAQSVPNAARAHSARATAPVSQQMMAAPADSSASAVPNQAAASPTVLPGRVEQAVAIQESEPKPELREPDSPNLGLSQANSNPLTQSPQVKGAGAGDSEAPLRVSNAVSQPFADSAARGTGSMRADVANGTDQAAINSAGALIEVSTTGPRTISVGKNATYGIDVVNRGRSSAQQLLVTFTVPAWIELTNMNLTSGSKEIQRETELTRFVWKIDRLEPGKSQRLSLDVVPRKAQVFDLNVEWSVAPLAGAVQVQVTEPLLKMAITGSDEVQFGQSALYNVTVRNPGTGIAENVNLMLSEVLGGERAALGNIGPGEERSIQVELIARSAGGLDLTASVTGDGNLSDSATKQIMVRRAQLAVSLTGPSVKYSGTSATYEIKVENVGDAMAQDVFTAIGLPAGVTYQSGIDGAERIEGGMRWSVGALPPGAQRIYSVVCLLNTSGPVQIEAGARGSGDLADAQSFQTVVETVADLVLSVEDPQGPLPVGQDVVYKILLKNRGTRTANNVDVVMHFSDGIEPTSAEGRSHKINPGEVVFETVGQLDPNEELVFTVTARANVAGVHMFRAQLTCDEADAKEVTQGTNRFFGDEVQEVNRQDESMEVGRQEGPSILR
jgi:hypothetical protein